MQDDNKKSIYKIKLSEKEQKVLYCTIFVIFLLLLAFGDKIALHFIKQSPNPNNRVFGSDEILTDSVFKESNIETISLEIALKKIKNNEKFYLLSTRDICYPCLQYMPSISEAIVKNNLNIYILNRGEIDKDSSYYWKFVGLDKRISEHFQYTPYLLYFERGELKKELVGLKNDDELKEFINKI